MRAATTFGLMVVCILVGAMLAAAGEPPPAPVITVPSETAPPPPPTTTTTTTTTEPPGQLSLAMALYDRRPGFELPEPEPPTDHELWADGYLVAGGPPDLLHVFLDEIVPCESRLPGFPDGAAHAIGPLPMTDSREWDFGFAQINRAAHGETVAALWPDLSFKEAMLDPHRNGQMAGRLAADSGTQPWYMSRGCHGR